MRRSFLIILVLGAAGILSSASFAQDNSLSSALHFSSQSSFLGATLSHDLVGFNRDKVQLRGTFSYLARAGESDGVGAQSADRFEVGVETKNTMQRGKGLFSVLGLAYTNSRSGEPGVATRDGGLMFAMGAGSRVASSVSMHAKYVFGKDNGVRMAMEVDF